MLVHQMRRADCSVEQISAFDSLLGDLPDGFRRALYPAREQLAALLGLPESRNSVERAQARNSRQSKLLKAEVIATDTHLFVLKAFRRGVPLEDLIPTQGMQGREIRPSYWLRLHSLGPEVNPEELTVLCDFLAKGFSTEFTEVNFHSPKFDSLKEEGRVSPPTPTAEELNAAEALSDKDSRTLAIAIKQASGLLVGDLERQLSSKARPRTEEIRRSLERTGIITAETVRLIQGGDKPTRYSGVS